MKAALLKANKKLLVITSLVVIIMLGIAGTTPPLKQNNFKNLKVLPQDISKEALESIMQEFKDGLGVDCAYCHAKANSTSSDIDFASDSNHIKEEARYMMRMTLQLNKESFQVKQPLLGDPNMVITCYTCHHGNTFPDAKMADTIPHKAMLIFADSLRNK